MLVTNDKLLSNDCPNDDMALSYSGCDEGGCAVTTSVTLSDK
jgi:hypothetical protein